MQTHINRNKKRMLSQLSLEKNHQENTEMTIRRTIVRKEGYVHSPEFYGAVEAGLSVSAWKTVFEILLNGNVKLQPYLNINNMYIYFLFKKLGIPRRYC